jgi:hypothetical protein
MTGPSGGIIVTGQLYVIWSDGGSWRCCPTGKRPPCSLGFLLYEEGLL